MATDTKKPLKVHAWENGKDNLMCGFPTTLESTTDRRKVTCARCLNELDDRADVALRGTDGPIPTMTLTATAMRAPPRMVVISKPNLELVPPFSEEKIEPLESPEKETTIEKPAHPLLTKGRRVYVPTGKSSDGLSIRTGTIEKLDLEKGGCLVRHDDGALLGWAWSEMKLERDVDVLTRLYHRVMGWLIRLRRGKL